MRVLQVYRDYFRVVPGGIERHVMDLATGIAGRAEVDVYSGSRRRSGEELRDGNVRVRLVGELGRIVGAPISPGLVSAIRSQNYDIVHIHCPNPTAEIALPRTRGRSVFVATYHADSARGGRFRVGYERWLARRLMRCERVVATSDKFVQSSRVLTLVASRSVERIEVIPLGVDTDFFSPMPQDRRPTVLFVGRLRYYKGLEVLIDAMRTVDAHLVIAGDGPERARIESLGREALGDRFKVIDEVRDEELPSLYRSASVFCLPSTSAAEAFGLSALEAMACGIPVVTTELGTGTSVINRDGETGLVVQPFDREALSGSLARIIDSPDEAKRMGEAARRRAVEHYDRKLMLDRVFDLYERLLAERSGV